MEHNLHSLTVVWKAGPLDKKQIENVQFESEKMFIMNYHG